jgi:hypothetical protein
MYEEIPNELNLDFNGIPAIRILNPQSPMAPSFEDIYYIHNEIVFKISMLDVDNKTNKELYDQILSTYYLER